MSVVSVAAQTELFPVARPTPEQIVERALEYKPVAIFALFSGGNGSLAATHWAMNNVPGCQVAHINTGIGIPATREFVRETCAREGWRLTEMRAKEDCGQDYEAIVRKHGFPGPASHRFMYVQLKERSIDALVRQTKTHPRDKVMFLTGICHDDSQRRSGYGGKEITHHGAQMWVNAMYWAGASWMSAYVDRVGIPRNPVAASYGMSGECLCGAFAKPGELAILRHTCPASAARIERLQDEVRAAGFPWGWEEAPPRERDDKLTPDLFSPMCVNCLKSERLAA